MATSETICGQPMDRVDGHLKVTGRATYAADVRLDKLAYAALVLSTVSSGRIKHIDSAPAEKSAGVLAVITHHNAARLHSQEQEKRPGVDPEVGEPLSPLQDAVIRYHGQPVATVISETFVQATYAASLVHVVYEDSSGINDFNAAAAKAKPPTPVKGGKPGKSADYQRGDSAAALAKADVRVDAKYSIAAEHHNPMELHATVASWDGARLTLYDKTQWVDNVQEQVALAFRLDKENVRVISPFVGGAFGAALRVWPHVLIAALAARHVKRPVKLVLTRSQNFTIPGYRPKYLQNVSLAATREGTLTAIEHEGIGQTSIYEEYTESLLDTTRQLYACPNVKTHYRLAAMNVNTPASMRGPGEVSGVFALESALDELAVALKVDPVELRLRNFAKEDPEYNLPWSSNSLQACYRQAAQRIGWDQRTPAPRSMSDGNQLIGYGMATATWPAKRLPASVRVQLKQDGSASIETAGSDIGPGTYTALTQIAADALGLAASQVTVVLGDTNLPTAPVQGGSMTIASIGSAVHEAATAMRNKVIKLAQEDPQSPLHRAVASDIEVKAGRLSLHKAPHTGESYAQLLQRHRQETLELTHSSKPGDETKKYAMRSFGAHFVEVRVDRDLGNVRVARVVSAFAAGRIINPKTAHSQAIGGIVGGIGMALLEHTRWDSRNGRIVNSNLADYHVPVHADIHPIEAFFIEETDMYSNPIGTKGLAELSIVGVAAAIANAVYHATGKRLRDLPITLESLL
ncbi:MAG: xanthine dehydrogenase [Planctomycetaceae bacterium]|nr:xanthine dehydrogenase [Planctomycetaceae bacterium]